MEQAKSEIKIAFIYDFDKTLSPQDMQEYSFFSEIGIEAEDFWKDVSEEADKQKADNIITYMQLMIEKAIANSKEDILTKEALKKQGKNIELFEGVTEWFSLVNDYAGQKDAEIEHYIISSGNKEIIEGTKIAKEFKKIYGCSFRFDKNDVAKSAGLAINYTNKTQYIFRINKGTLEEEDHTEINKFILTEKRRIPFENMIYFGDGETDIPCMKLVKEKGGYAIAVYHPKHSKDRVTELLSDDRINFFFPADYGEKSKLFETCKMIIDKIVAQRKLKLLELKQKENINI